MGFFTFRVSPHINITRIPSLQLPFEVDRRNDRGRCVGRTTRKKLAVMGRVSVVVADAVAVAVGVAEAVAVGVAEAVAVALWRRPCP